VTETISPRDVRHDFAGRDTPDGPGPAPEGAGQLPALIDAAPAAG